MNRIPYAKQSVSEADVQAVVDVLRSQRLTQGEITPRFEQAVATCCGARHAVAVCNGSMALIAACMALDAKPGSRIWTSPNTFIATANAALHCGAEVDFVDIDPATGNMSVSALEDSLEQAESQGRLPDIVIPVHYAGLPCDLEAIHALSRRYGFRIIEDAAHALGATYQGEPVGGCHFSDLTVLSFHPVKSITTGEGGMILTNDAALYQRLRDIALQGIVREPSRWERPEEGGWYYEQQRLGYNLRLTDIQAALGLSQLERLPDFIQRRQDLASRYHDLLKSLPVRRPTAEAYSGSAWHLYVIQLKKEGQIPDRKAVVKGLSERGVGCQVHYIPVHTQPYYRRRGFDWGDYPNAEAFYRCALSLPLFPDLTNEEQNQVVSALKRVLSDG